VGLAVVHGDEDADLQSRSCLARAI
jgi:hypothetical protein